MNCKIPFTKDIDFEKTVSEITSISLEHETKVEGDTLKGNFIVSGDFKSHEVSVNKEPFSYILPFEIDLTSNIDKNSIEFMIEDFTYEIKDSSILRVNIDFNVIAAAKEEENEPLFKDAREVFGTEPLLEEPKEIEEPRQNNESLTLEDQETIINSVNSLEQSYITYHIHIVNDGESLDTICTMYNINASVLQEYNDLSNITAGDKLIIPQINE